jgi:hypothetical protein
LSAKPPAENAKARHDAQQSNPQFVSTVAMPTPGSAPLRQVDMVNHPPHYTGHPSGVECITITRHMGFNLGNAVKYIWRADLKGSSIEDLEKAAWYIADEIAKRKAAG